MNEQQRQDYLKVMGVQPFYLKKVLPAAKQAPDYTFPKIAADLGDRHTEFNSRHVDYGTKAESSTASSRKSPPHATAGEFKSGEGSSARRAKIDDLKAELRQTAEAVKPAAAKKSPQETGLEQQIHNPDQAGAASESSEAIEFRIRFLHINSNLAVIDELPFAQADSFPPANNELLKAVLAALKVNWNEADIRIESFSWPIDAAFDYEGDPKLAAELMLKGFIAQHHAANSFSNLLVFAGQLESVLASPEGQGSDFVETSQGYYVTVTSSLAAMLAYPLLKKQVWAALQPLRKRLAKTI